MAVTEEMAESLVPGPDGGIRPSRTSGDTGEPGGPERRTCNPRLAV